MSLLILSILFIATASQEIAVQNFRVGILAKDQEATSEHLKTIPVFSKSSELFSATDAGQRLYISFNLLNKADNSKFSGAQQVFLHFAQENGEDAVLVANPQASGEYLYDATLRVASKQFNNLAGKFKGSLIIGGNTIKTPINWHFADFQLALPTVPVITPKSQQINYSQLPEIQHQFRQPEKRPSAVISDFFTLVVLTPLIFLVGAWLKIGINFGNAPTSIWVPIFHAGLAGIVGLFFVFWLQLDMFETLKYLAILGFVTFVAGNRVLRQLATASKSKSE